MALQRPIDGVWPYLWLDATYVKVRHDGRIVSVAVIVAVGVNGGGRREVLGIDIGAPEAESFWVEFLRKLKWRCLAGVRLVISDAHEGIKAAVARVFRATLAVAGQALAALPRALHAQRTGACRPERPSRRLRRHFHRRCQNDAESACQQWRRVADQLRPKLATLMDQAEPDGLAYMGFPAEHRAKLHSRDEVDKRFRR